MRSINIKRNLLTHPTLCNVKQVYIEIVFKLQSRINK